MGADRSKKVGMKTYRNEHHGFEIRIPEEWSVYTEGKAAEGNKVVIKCRANEAFHIEIGPLTVTPFLYQVENEFRRFAEQKGFTSLVLGRCTADHKEHVCARFYMGYGQWMKQYRILLRGFGYMLTATCLDETSLLEMEKDWDEVASSFYLVRENEQAVIEPEEQENRVLVTWAAQPVSEPPQTPPRGSIPGLKMYRNEKHGFEIDVPENWSPPPAEAYEYMNMLNPLPPGMQKDVFQYGNYEEAFNFEIAPLFPEPLLTDTEVEFKLFVRTRGFRDLRMGRIVVAGKEHVCASYSIDDEMGKRWNKKYMIVFGGVEYAITGTSQDLHWFAKREKDWDAIIQTFRVVKPYDDSANSTDKAERDREQRREIVQKRIQMRNALGELYAQAYEFVAMGRYREARSLLEKCLEENPDHVMAHKEMAVVLEKLGDIKGAIHHRREVKRLSPEDEVNRSKLDRLLIGSGKESEDLHNVREFLKTAPGHPVYRDIEKQLSRSQGANYKVTFYSSLICLLLSDISFFYPEYIVIRYVWCMSLLMLMPAWGVWTCGPWVGLPRTASRLLAGALYLFFLFNAWK
jgi:tetratricopeptide (TPR) repeat protein